MRIVDAPVRFKAGPKIPTARDASKHKAGGGDVKIGNFGTCSRILHRSSLCSHECDLSL
jgi:hypothetical protein